MAFHARYPGDCEMCSVEIQPGDLIESVPNIVDEYLYRHAQCPPEPVLAPPCPGCFMVPATNGACGCDE